MTYDSSTIFDSSTTYDGSGGGSVTPGPSTTSVSASVQIGFTSNPLAASVTWTDVTPWVELVTTTMGRQHELQQVNPSQATVTLTNQDGRFSPWNTGSPYYHSGTGLVPGHPIRVVAVNAGVTYPVFYGYIKGFVPAYGQTKATMSIQCYDALALLNLNTMDVNTAVLYPLAHAQNYWPFSDPTISVNATDLVAGKTAYSYNAPPTFGVAGPLINTAITAVSVPSATGFLTTTNAGATGVPWSVELWTKNTAAASVGITIYGDGYGAIGIETSTGHPVAETGYGLVQAIGSKSILDGAWHYLVGTYDGTTLSLYVDGALAAAATGSDTGSPGPAAFPAGLDFGGVNGIAQAASYPSVLAASVVASQYALATAGFVTQDSGSRINAVLELAGVPSALNNVGTGDITVQGATSSLATTTMMSYLNTVVNSERGLLYQDGAGVIQFRNRHYVYENSTSNSSQATFGYTSSQLNYFSTGLVPGEDDLDLWNNIPVQRQNGVIQTASDATSQAQYGRRTLTGYSSLLFTTDGDAYDLAGGLLYQYKQPATRVRAISMDSTINGGANLPQMLGRQLLDRITINWRPMDGSGVDFSQQSLIEQITHTIEPQKWTTTFAVTPIGTETFWRWGISKWGTDVWGF